MHNKRKKLSLHLLYLFLLTSFLFIFIDCANARAGGGGGGGGGGRGGGGFHSSSRSRRRSRPLTAAEIEANQREFEANIKNLLRFSPIHLLCFFIVVYRLFTQKSNNYNSHSGLQRNTEISDNIFLSFALLFFSAIFAMAWHGFIILADLAIIYFAARALFKFHSLVPFGYEEEFNKKQKTDGIVSKIQISDPDFDIDIFRNRVVKAFVKIQNSWSNQDLRNIRFLLADGTYEQFQIQINEMRSKHIKDIMREIEISSIELEKYESSENYDSVYVEIKAKAINYKINLDNGSIFDGDKNSKDFFTEIWCFCRSKKAKSIRQKGIIEGYCPNCSSSISYIEDSKCSSCGSILKNGQLDWILAGIYQKYEWKETHNSHIPGLSHLLNEDPNFNIQNIEDKLSVIFWRLIESQREKSPTPILKICTDKFANHFFDSNIQNILENNTSAGIDSIEVKGISRLNDKNILLAVIIWNGFYKYSLRRLHNKTLFVLKRDIDCITDISKAFCGIHCPSCGAKDTYNRSKICEACNNPANDESKDWMLDSILDYEDSKAKFLLTKAEEQDKDDEYTVKATPKINHIQNYEGKEVIYSKYSQLGISWEKLNSYSQKDLLRFIVATMLADNIIDFREMQTIREIASVNQISEREIQSCINELESKEDPLKYTLATSNIELDKNLLMVLIIIAAADGEITDSEYTILLKVAENINISKFELRNLINNVYEGIWNKKINPQKELYLFN